MSSIRYKDPIVTFEPISLTGEMVIAGPESGGDQGSCAAYLSNEDGYSYRGLRLPVSLPPRMLIAETGLATEPLRVRRIDEDEGRRLVRIVRRGSGSVLTSRRPQMVPLSVREWASCHTGCQSGMPAARPERSAG